MYLWVVLATFLALIAGYYLPVRHDTHDIVNVPVAQAKFAQLTTQHRSAVARITHQNWPYCCYTAADQLCCTKNCSCKADSQNNTKVPYQTGPIDLQHGEGASELPIGFNYSEAYPSYIQCFEPAETLEQRGTTSPKSSCDLNSEHKSDRLVFTFGPVPKKWIRYIEEGGNYKPLLSQDYINAMSIQLKDSDIAGYITTDKSSTVITPLGKEYTIPSAIKTIYNNCVESNGICLFYMTWM